MGETTATKAVLAIGIDPAYADLSALPGFTPEMVRAYLQNQIDRINEYGHEAVSCLIDTGATAEGVVEAALCSRQFDCVVIGAGLREPPELLLLLRKCSMLCIASHPARELPSTQVRQTQRKRRSDGSTSQQVLR